MKPKILYLDIETAPHTVHCWGLWDQNIGLNQIMDTGRILCFAYRWDHEKGLRYISERDGKATMLDTAHALLGSADIVVTYNGKKFDVPTLYKEFLEYGLAPPAPFKHVDLYRTIKSKFRFASNKMDHIAASLGYKTKVRHQGHELWVKCMAGDAAAWRKMERYNKRDVLILERIYKRVLPWISDHPNMALYSPVDRPTCTNCGSTKVHSRGSTRTKVGVYLRYHCNSCGSWMRSRYVEKTNLGKSKNTNILTQEVI